MDVKRVNKEAIELRGDIDKCGVVANTVGDDMSHWKGQVRCRAKPIVQVLLRRTATKKETFSGKSPRGWTGFVGWSVCTCAHGSAPMP